MNLLRQKRILMGIGALAVLIFAILALASYFSEPRYQGRRLSEWLVEYQRGNPRAKEAILAIGDEGVPTLLKILFPSEALSVKALLDRIKFLRIDLVQDHSGDETRLARMGFHLLGTNAAVGIPRIIPFLGDRNRAHFAWEVMGEIGAPALPVIHQCLAGTNNVAKEHAVRAILRLKRYEDSTLNSLLTNADPILRAETYLCLTGAKRTLGARAYELALAGLDDPHWLVASRAAVALRVLRATNALPRLYQMQKSFRMRNTTNSLVAREIESTIAGLNKHIRVERYVRSKTNRVEERQHQP